MSRHREDPMARFSRHAHPEPNSGCWLWAGSITASGYGQMWTGTRRMAAHRFGYERLVGKVSQELDMDHLCRNRACVNPAHLEPVTRSENARRGMAATVRRHLAAKVTHCPSGHPYDEANTYRHKTRVQGRGCRTCRRLARQKADAARRLKQEATP